MIFWIIPVLFALAFLSWILIRALKQYENENAAAALAGVQKLEEQLLEIEERLKTLEAIESDLILDAEKGKEMPDSAEYISSGRKPVSE